MHALSERSKTTNRKVIPDPINDREFQEVKESGKDGILFGITLNPKKCIGETARRMPLSLGRVLSEGPHRHQACLAIAAQHSGCTL